MLLEQPGVPIQKTLIMSKVLEQGLDIKHSSIPPKKSRKVLTSSENLKLIKEKKEEKEEERKKTERKRYTNNKLNLLKL